MKGRFVFISLMLWGFLFSNLFAQSPGTHIYQPGEMLQYKVRWGFIRLGTIIITTTLDSNLKKTTYYRITMKVQSSPYLPFISIDETNHSTINSQTGMSKFFFARHRSGSDRTEINYVFDEALKQAFVSIKDCKENRYDKLDIICNVPPYLEGPSLFFYARREIFSGKCISVPTMIAGKLETTHLDFSGPIEYIDVSAFPDPVRVRRYEGIADWEGGTAAGMSGDFTGWITDDLAAIPVQSELSILLGSLVIELEEYQRKDWSPPLQQNLNVLSRKED